MTITIHDRNNTTAIIPSTRKHITMPTTTSPTTLHHIAKARMEATVCSPRITGKMMMMGGP